MDVCECVCACAYTGMYQTLSNGPQLVIRGSTLVIHYVSKTNIMSVMQTAGHHDNLVMAVLVSVVQ